MGNDVSVPLKGMEDAEAAYRRMEAAALALKPEGFTPMNVDVVSGASIILGRLEAIRAHREAMVRLTGWDPRNIDELEDRAKAAWFAFVTNLPEPEPKDFQAMFEECKALRTLLLSWAEPLVLSGKFDRTAVAKIKEGSGNKDIPSDVVSLVVLFRSKWDEIKNMCGVTEEQLERGAQIAPVVFATVSRRENASAASTSDGSQRVRRFWTLADTAYDECQRALWFLRWHEGDAEQIAPSLRRNSGTRASSQLVPEPPASPATPPAPGAPAAPAGPVVGGGSNPFPTR